jgi:uncharacterized protein (DUF1015 family)
MGKLKFRETPKYKYLGYKKKEGIYFLINYRFTRMVTVKPFNGIHYNKNKIDINTVTAPPYDIISPELQNDLYKKSNYNLVRLTYGKQDSQDDNNNNQYSRAATLFHEWLKNQILIRDDKPALYPYQVEYRYEGKKKILTGFFALIKLDTQYEQVKAHEHTLAKPKEDRLNLMRACQANLEPIELLFQDDKNVIDTLISRAKARLTPTMEITAWNGINKCWTLTGDIANRVCNHFTNKKVYIADGHHRYQTAINYFHENKKAGYRLALFVNMDNPGLAILPTHRLIYGLNLDIKNVLSRLKKFFTIKENPDITGTRIMDNIKGKKHVFALYADKIYFLKLNQGIIESRDKKHSKRWHNLDVSILQEIILKKVLDISPSQLENHVHYTRFEKEAREFVDMGKYQMAILLNSIEMNDLKSLAVRGEYLPQKSTYFLPKILSGLVMHGFQ